MVSTQEPYFIGDVKSDMKRVIVVDYGIKNSILHNSQKEILVLKVVPHNYGFVNDLISGEYHGLFFNGP